jgi:glycosyltransferase involved in cell wall biosynthesis
MIRLGFYVENYIIGGTERYLADLLAGLDRSQYDISLFSNPNRAFKDYLLMRGLGYIPHWTIPILPPYPYLAVRYANKRLRRINQNNQHSQRRKQSQYLKRGKEIVNGLWRYATAGPNLVMLASALRSRPIDILHINNGGYPGAETCRLAVLAANWVKIPVRLMSIHNQPFETVFPQKMERFIDRLIHESLSLIIVTSDTTRYSLEKVRGFPTTKMRTVNLGIGDPDPVPSHIIDAKREELGIGPYDRIVGIVANFEERKGHTYLLHGVPEIRSCVPNIKFVLVGAGELLKSMVDLAINLGISQHVIFTGFRNDISHLLATFDINVLTSLAFESNPLINLEAMALRKPVVATNISGIREAVEDGVTGILVPPADSKSLAQAIISLLMDKSKARAMGEAGRARYLKQFTLKRMINAVEHIYAEQTGRVQLMRENSG